MDKAALEDWVNATTRLWVDAIDPEGVLGLPNDAGVRQSIATTVRNIARRYPGELDRWDADVQAFSVDRAGPDHVLRQRCVRLGFAVATGDGGWTSRRERDLVREGGYGRVRDMPDEPDAIAGSSAEGGRYEMPYAMAYVARLGARRRRVGTGEPLRRAGRRVVRDAHPQAPDRPRPRDVLDVGPRVRLRLPEDRLTL